MYFYVFRSSSAVEQLTVNQLVVGSIPTCGAILNSPKNFPKNIAVVGVPLSTEPLLVVGVFWLLSPNMLSVLFISIPLASDPVP